MDQKYKLIIDTDDAQCIMHFPTYMEAYNKAIETYKNWVAQYKPAPGNENDEWEWDWVYNNFSCFIMNANDEDISTATLVTQKDLMLLGWTLD